MTTVVRRTFLATPRRDALATWQLIVDLLSEPGSLNRSALLNVSGIAASIIGDKCPEESPIIVTCDGPRTRIYCAYDDAALDNSNAEEDRLGFDPLQGDWKVSLPSHADDLDWVVTALKARGERVVARDRSESPSAATIKVAPLELVIDPEGFLRR
jgi:hypothetical protein